MHIKNNIPISRDLRDLATL